MMIDTPWGSRVNTETLEKYKLLLSDYKTPEELKSALNVAHKQLNAAKKKLQDAAYRNANRSKRNLQSKIYKKNNPRVLTDEEKEVQRKNRRCRQNKRVSTDIEFRLGRNYRRRLLKCLTSQVKDEHSLEFLGCDISTLRRHLEDRFLPGMSWSNYGGKDGCWVMDHFCPCAEYYLQNKDEARVCFHYTNIVPLWHTDNMMKHDSIVLPCPS
jgi:hypothetical protein